jgi:hypothetical protein
MQTFEILLYTAPEGNMHIEVFYEDETFWLSQKKMAELFGVEVPTINYHLKEIFKTKELDESSTIRIFRIVQNEGARNVNREIEFYNLDAIIAVGYRVNSIEATRFRIWSTRTLREYIIKGFILDDERLKQGKNFGRDYFEELLERIREIRASERRFYQKITDIFAQCSMDYDPHSEPRRLSPIQRICRIKRRRPHQCRHSQKTRRRTILPISRHPGPRIFFRLR